MVIFNDYRYREFAIHERIVLIMFVCGEDHFESQIVFLNVEFILGLDIIEFWVQELFVYQT